ncbi:hypothetical protein GCM10010266_09070 [Streptomyces griseomycini]|uniref:hypothetical protein n=1 Tax=Streptomyces griseomycini TaxID=66895 RepID=UPI0018745D9C|nr:hypothetical protein [Streptomyces griseomycini]GGP88153.1 hypothetical protein GCM10010266_09070 [Streptomyces griseomycini]
MGSLRLALCTGALAAAAFAPTAYAAGGEGVSVVPAAPAPGSEVTLEVAGCTGRTAVAVSPAFVSDARLTVAGDVLVGESRVRSSLTAGTYGVRVDCGGTERTGTLEVAPASAPSGRPTASAPSGRPAAPAVPVTPASPVAPVDAGGGATARMAAGTSREGGPGTAQTVIGLALVAAAAVAVVRDRVRRSGGAG